MKYKAVLAVAIAAAFLAAPFALVSDGSDAYTITEGEAGIGYSLKNVSKENILKLKGEDFSKGIAVTVLKKVVDGCSPTDYKISDANVSDLDVSQYMGKKIKDGVETTVSSSYGSITVEFKATSEVTDRDVFTHNYKNEDIFRELGTGYVSNVGDVFTIKATYETSVVSIKESTVAKNSEENFVVTEYSEKSCTGTRVTAEVKYTCTVDGKPKTIEYETEYESSYSEDSTRVYDFNGVKIEDVKGSTMCFMDETLDDNSSVYIDRVTFDSSTKGRKTVSTIDDYKRMTDHSGSTLVDAIVNAVDYKVPTYKFYGDDQYSLYHSSNVADESLRSNDAMKKFLQDNGEIVETFDDAYSSANSEYKTASEKKDNKLLYIGIAAGAVAIIAIAAIAIIMIRKR